MEAGEVASAAFWSLFVGGFILYFIRGFTKTGLPNSPSKADFDVFAKSKPDETVHDYFFDNTGFAIDVKTRGIFLYINGRSKLYTLYDIRSVKKNWVVPDRIILPRSYGVSDKLNQIKFNSEFQKRAYDQSGLFISLADVNNPVAQVKFRTEQDLDIAYEVFSQFLEGSVDKLIAEFKSKEKTNKSAEQEKIRRKADGLCTLCGLKLKTSMEQALGYCRNCRDDNNRT